MKYLGFTETSRFVRRVQSRLGDDELARLQWYLCQHPDDGDIIPGAQGLRKLRWLASGRGKRGGARVIYYWAVSNERILLLDIYTKNEKSDLSRTEIGNLRQDVERWLESL